MQKWAKNPQENMERLWVTNTGYSLPWFSVMEGIFGGDTNMEPSWVQPQHLLFYVFIMGGISGASVETSRNDSDFNCSPSAAVHTIVEGQHTDPLEPVLGSGGGAAIEGRGLSKSDLYPWHMYGTMCTCRTNKNSAHFPTYIPHTISQV